MVNIGTFHQATSYLYTNYLNNFSSTFDEYGEIIPKVYLSIDKQTPGMAPCTAYENINLLLAQGFTLELMQAS